MNRRDNYGRMTGYEQSAPNTVYFTFCLSAVSCWVFAAVLV